MDYQVLDELMSIRKKGEAAKDKREAYTTEMIKLLNEESISKDAQHYLREGFSFEGSKCVAIYLQSLDPIGRKKEIDKLLSSNVYCTNERGIAFKISISLLGFAFNMFSDDIEVTKSLMIDLPNKAHNKEGNLSKDIQSTIEKYFFGEILVATKLPDFARPELQDGRLIGFKRIILKSINSNSISTKVKPAIIEKIKNWVSTDIEATPLLQGNDKSSLHNEDDNAHVSAMSTHDAMHMKKIIEDMFDRVVFTSKKFEAINIELTQKNEYIRRLEDEKKGMSLENCTLKKHIDDNGKAISELKRNINNKDSEITAQQLEVEGLKNEIKKLNSVLTVYSADKNNAQTEQLNAIASKLRSDYRDFKDAENMEMTIDLGENLRVQLKSVFKILEKAGIIIERR